MRELSIDIETYSSGDLIKGGVAKYVEAPDFTILLFAYSYDRGPVTVIDCTRDEIPAHVLRDLHDKRVRKTAYNAPFEIECISTYTGTELDASQWDCTLVRAARAGYPLGLGLTSRAMGFTGKLDSGKALIKYFSVPCRPTKVNGGRTRNLPEHAPEKWAQFIEYCREDVVQEMAVRDRALRYKVSQQERQLWVLDHKINSRGVMVDPTLVHGAIKIDQKNAARLLEQARRVTGLPNPKSVAQLKNWLEEQGIEVPSLGKQIVSDLLKQDDLPKKVREALTLRQQLSKSSIKKYDAMLHSACSDNRIRGLFQFYGAMRTGRWAGRRVQLQNLTRNELSGELLTLARELVKRQDMEGLESIFGDVSPILSQLVRTGLVATPGSRFIVSDFSAIEARVLAWLAGEQWRLDVFATHGMIYEASAAQMFRVALESIVYKDANGKKQQGPNYDLRQKGKVSELALGYGGGPGALISMGALRMGLQEAELWPIVEMWRDANPAIVKLWKDANRAILQAVKHPGRLVIFGPGIEAQMRRNDLYVTLPSGRELCYVQARIGVNRFEGECVQYMSMNDRKMWVLEDTYGGKIIENITQAIARDCLAEAMLRLDAAGYNLVMHVHDETVSEMPYGKGSLFEANAIMSRPMPWAEDLPLRAEGFETEYYMKD